MARRGVSSDDELAARRRARRLRRELGVNAAGVEVIVTLRTEVLSLQTRVRELEAELSYHSRRRASRFTSFRDASYEAVWLELDESESHRVE